MKAVIKFSLSTECFYDSRIHKDVLPEDAIEVTQEEFQQLSAGRNTGKRIVLAAGQLGLVDREPVSLTQEEIEAKERGWRDAKLASAQWLRDRHRDQVEIGAKPTLTPKQFNELLVYLQVLRDWPQSAQFPDIEHRPVAPSWISEASQ